MLYKFEHHGSNENIFYKKGGGRFDHSAENQMSDEI